jgi:hypothetical protein
MEWQGGYCGYTPARGQAFRLTPDTAFIAEAIMVHSNRDDAAAAIEARFALRAAPAAVAMGRVERLLMQRGVVVADAVSMSSLRGGR